MRSGFSQVLLTKSLLYSCHIDKEKTHRKKRLLEKLNAKSDQQKNSVVKYAQAKLSLMRNLS